MAQNLKVEVGGINIRIHPHSPERYRDLFRAAFEMKKIVSLRGDRAGMVTSLNRIKKDDRYVYGTLTTFLEIDLKGDWLNTETLEAASDDDVEEVSIPDYLRPNMMSFFFRFDVQNHELVFEHYGKGQRLTHNSALTFFRGLLKNKTIERVFGDVKVTLIQSRGSIDRLFAIPRITRIEIYIEKPNSDIWGDDFDELAEEHLDDKNARSVTITYKAEQGKGIERDEDLTNLVTASIQNGHATAKGYGPDGHETVTTNSYPKVVQGKFDPDLSSDSQMFEALANRFRSR